MMDKPTTLKELHALLSHDPVMDYSDEGLVFENKSGAAFVLSDQDLNAIHPGLRSAFTGAVSNSLRPHTNDYLLKHQLLYCNVVEHLLNPGLALQNKSTRMRNPCKLRLLQYLSGYEITGDVYAVNYDYYAEVGGAAKRKSELVSKAWLEQHFPGAGAHVQQLMNMGVTEPEEVATLVFAAVAQKVNNGQANDFALPKNLDY